MRCKTSKWGSIYSDWVIVLGFNRKVIICVKNNTRTCSGKSAIRISSGNALWFFFLQARSHKESEIINTDAVSSEKWKYIFLFSGLFRWARMVCGGFICTKNALCALNIVYVVSRNLLLLYGLYGNVTERWRRGGRRRGRRRSALKKMSAFATHTFIIWRHISELI